MNVLTLDEAIKHCEEVAEEQEWQAYKSLSRTDDERMSCLECAEEHRQLAEWLKKLQAYRDERVGCEYCKHNFRKQHERPCSLCKHNFLDMFEREVNADGDSD